MRELLKNTSMAMAFCRAEEDREQRVWLERSRDERGRETISRISFVNGSRRVCSSRRGTCPLLGTVAEGCLIRCRPYGSLCHLKPINTTCILAPQFALCLLRQRHGKCLQRFNPT